MTTRVRAVTDDAVVLTRKRMRIAQPTPATRFRQRRGA
jgi:hypothetical protein